MSDIEGASDRQPFPAGWFVAQAPEPIQPVDSWPDLDLLAYDPAATAAQPIADLFAQRHHWRVGTKAGLLALATSIPDPAGRAAAAAIFEELLEDARWNLLFRTWSKLAPLVDCPRTLALAIELKTLWAETPRFWRFRTAPGRPSRYDASARANFSWTTALAVAEAGCSQPAERLLDEDWLLEWEELDAPCPGFWSFASYARIRAEGDEAEAAVFARMVADRRRDRALHTHDFCEYLGSGRRTGAWDPDRDRGPALDADITGRKMREPHGLEE